MRECILALLVGCFVVTGCSSSGPVAIDGEDRNVSFPEGEIVVTLGSGSSQHPGRDYSTIYAGYARSEGQFDQTLTNDEFVNVDGTEIHGPVTLDNKARLDVAYLGMAAHSYISESFVWYGGGGLGFLDLDLTTTTADQRSTLHESGLNLHGSLGLAYHITPAFGIEGNIKLYMPLFFPVAVDSATLLDQRVQFFVTPTESLRLFAGFRTWSYGYEETYSLIDRSDINVVFSGPTAGVVLRF